MKKAQFPSKASSLSWRGRLGYWGGIGRFSPFLPYLFRSLGRCQLAPILMKVFVLWTSVHWHLASAQVHFIRNTKQLSDGPEFGRTPNEYNAPCHWGRGVALPIAELAHCLTPDQHLPYFCELRFAHWSKYLGWIKPELTDVCLRTNDCLGPCFSSLITQFFFSLLITPQRRRGEGRVRTGIYFPTHPPCCLVVQLLDFVKNKCLKPMNQFDIFGLLV